MPTHILYSAARWRRCIFEPRRGDGAVTAAAADVSGSALRVVDRRGGTPLDPQKVQEITKVLEAAPPQWLTTLSSVSIRSSLELQRRAITFNEALTADAKCSSRSADSGALDELQRKVGDLERMLGKQTSRRPAFGGSTRRPAFFKRNPPAREAHRGEHGGDFWGDGGLDVTGGDDSDVDGLDDEDDDDYDVLASLPEEAPSTKEVATAAQQFLQLASAYLSATTSNRRSGPFDFATADYKSAKKPPSPCKCCGSDAHWDRDCPHWLEWLKRKKEGRLKYDTERPKDHQRLYKNVYTVMRNEELFQAYVLELADPEKRRACRVRVQEEEDEYKTWYASLSHAQDAILEDATPPAPPEQAKLKLSPGEELYQAFLAQNGRLSTTAKVSVPPHPSTTESSAETSAQAPDHATPRVAVDTSQVSDHTAPRVVTETTQAADHAAPRV
ncbi:hypothetical protein EXIGLDRAFT_699470, partial [Exidia glandulosa HHB12029]